MVKIQRQTSHFAKSINKVWKNDAAKIQFFPLHTKKQPKQYVPAAFRGGIES